MDIPKVKDKMYQRYKASEKIRDAKEMQKFMQKMVNVRPESDIFKKFKDLTKDDRKIMEYCNLVSYYLIPVK